jgi:hypothetical protein
MTTLVQLLARYAIWFYVLGAVVALYYLRELIGARRAGRQSLFGLEREHAMHRRTRAALMLALLALSLGAVAVLAHVVAPRLAGETPAIATQPTSSAPFVATPPTDTPTPRPSASAAPSVAARTPQPTGTPMPEPTGAEPPPTEPPLPPVAGCGDPNQNLTSPQPGAVVSGIVSIYGTADIAGFEYYKFEVRGEQTNGEWVTTAVFRQPARDTLLGTWDTVAWQPGPYELRLVVVDNTGNFPEPCVVALTVQSAGP